MKRKKYGKGPESDPKGLFYTGWSDQEMPSEETFEHMTEGSQGMSHAKLREGRESFSRSGKAHAKARRRKCAQRVQETPRRPVCLGGVSEGRVPG